MMTHDEIKADILQYLSDEYWYCKDKNGRFNVEMYADYRDELCESSINEILQADDPYAAFYEKMDEMYMEEEWHLFDEEFDKIMKRYDIPEECEDDARYILEAYLDFYAPTDHFLKQDVCVDIMMDTGDGNYDYVLNSVYPCWYGQEKERIDDKSSLLWLAKQQGYTKTQLWRALLTGDISDPKGFLESCRQEVANITSQMNTLTFLVKMPLRDVIKLNQMVKLQDRNGHFWDATKNPYCGYLVLDKSVMCGLYNPWGGGGSVLEIQCEKDVKIPVRFIRSALPDGADGYSVESVYGMCGSAWEECLKEIHVPNEFKKEIA